MAAWFSGVCLQTQGMVSVKWTQKTYIRDKLLEIVQQLHKSHEPGKFKIITRPVRSQLTDSRFRELLGRRPEQISIFKPMVEDLIQWEFVNELLSVQESGDLGPERIVERPKVIYNDETDQYVMWMHIDSSNYGDARAGVATDTDGTAYLLTEDPWSEWTNFAPEGSKTFTSQSTFVLEKDGVVIYMGDRWVPGNLASSTYVWMPLTISGTKATLNEAEAWTFTEGGWDSAEPVATLPAISDDSTLGGSARSVTDERVGYIGGPDNGTLTFKSVSASGSGKHTVQISYRNGDGSQRYCAVVVNDKSYSVAFGSTGTSLGTSVLHAQFADGSKNEIRFEGLDGKYCPDIQELVIS
ncbi:hypothetical protein N8T08_010714 [Aspergillus melleus]|uniref:Uncharacterized protein n=1 Tax=Aspergillus melleus TaxID=138277 RepID=A0ACC3BBK8_9EURO|nr:hypothetical protein N8T08_010714 [Aspergillus melleus]